jgi:hypothetical protein
MFEVDVKVAEDESVIVESHDFCDESVSVIALLSELLQMLLP